MHKTTLIGKGSRNILVLSGVHGNELTSIYTSYLLKDQNWANINEKFKTLTILGAVNNSGIKKNKREIIENKISDINRMFSNEYCFDFNKLKNEIDENDVIIDLHSSPFCTEFILLNQDLTTNSYIDFCINNDIQFAVRYSDQNTIKKYCIEKEKIAFTIELNQLDYINFKSAEKGQEIVNKIIKNIDDLKIQKSPPTFSPMFPFYTHYKGLFIRKIEAGSIIKKPNIIGQVIDIDSFKHSTVTLPLSGIYRVICLNEYDYVSPDNCVCILQSL